MERQKHGKKREIQEIKKETDHGSLHYVVNYRSALFAVPSLLPHSKREAVVASEQLALSINPPHLTC